VVQIRHELRWAAMNLQVADLPVWGNGNDLPPYPIEMVRAIAVVWCFTALRSDEIRRLRVGCIRRQYEDVMIPETGEILPRDATCFLDVPINKTMSAYTKPVHPLVGKRINEWEQVRPHAQPREADQKTSETVQFLFSLRGVRISKAYINDSLIPLLCAKAGVPIEDSRGKITSHRARDHCFHALQCQRAALHF
jgi:integrase